MSWRTVYTSLVRHRTKTYRQYATRHRLHRSLHSRKFLIRKEASAVPLTTRINTHQPKTRLKCQQYSEHSREPREKEKEEWKTSVIYVARQIVLKPGTQHHVVVTTNAHGLKMVAPRALATSSQCTFAARGNMDISLDRPFYLSRTVAIARSNLQST